MQTSEVGLRPLRAFRHALGITREELSRALDVSYALLDKYEADMPQSMIDRLTAYAKSIGREDAIPLLFEDALPLSDAGRQSQAVRKYIDLLRRGTPLMKKAIISLVDYLHQQLPPE